MTIPEASQLVLQAGALGKGGEIFILDMGEPVRILDLAKETIRLSGLMPDVDIKIVFSGIRPGEKLVEELESDAEKLYRTEHPKIFLGKIAALSAAQIREMLTVLGELCDTDDNDRIRQALTRFLPESQIGSAATQFGQVPEPTAAEVQADPELVLAAGV